jgi:hypothetical protein
MKKYWPLVCLILVAAASAGAIIWSSQKGWMSWMSYFMGFFLCQFALLKLFNPIQFADGFQMYDLIAKKSRIYALAYPFIELVLGLSYLAFFLTTATAILTILILGAGALGVILALMKGLDVRCACMGTVLDVPLSTVTLTEDLGMVAMSILLLIYA